MRHWEEVIARSVHTAPYFTAWIAIVNIKRTNRESNPNSMGIFRVCPQASITFPVIHRKSPAAAAGILALLAGSSECCWPCTLCAKPVAAPIFLPVPIIQLVWVIYAYGCIELFFLFCFTCLFVFNVSAYAGVRWVCLICCLVFKKGISLKIQKLQISMLKFFMIIKWQGNKLKPLFFRSKKNWMFFFFFPLMTSCHWPLSSPEVPPWGTGNGINWLLWISVGDKWIWFGLFSFSQMKTEKDWTGFQTVTKKKE